MQGSNADIIKVAMVRIHDRLREEGRGARLVLQVHDELLLEVPDAEVSAVKELVRDEMVRRVRPRPAARGRRRHRATTGARRKAERRALGRRLAERRGGRRRLPGDRAARRAGLDHTSFRPYLDPLGDEFRLLYVDERGQGRSERVDPATLSLDVFARDVDLLAEALEPGAVRAARPLVRRDHHDEARDRGSALPTAYVISGGGDSSAALEADVDASLEAMGEAGVPIKASWEQEKTVATEDELKELLRVQMPFHFAGDVPPGFGDETLGTPDVLRHFANIGYGDFDYVPDLHRVVQADARRSSASTTARPPRGRPALSTRGSPAAASSSSPESAT